MSVNIVLFYHNKLVSQPMPAEIPNCICCFSRILQKITGEIAYYLEKEAHTYELF